MSLSLSCRLPRARLMCALVASCFATQPFANPAGPSVVAGQASFNTVGKSLTVTNSPNAIINWQGFSIGAGEITRFAQQSASSAVLNRVVGQDPSAILGTLTSNGRVYLVNPNGILFGQGSRVDVAGLVASTLNLSNQDFLAGRLNFETGATAGSIVNQGDIVTGSGGRVLLIAPDVQNHGLISSAQGEVVLAAGKSVQLVEADLPMLKVEVSSGGEALNVGRIIAEGGKIGVYAGLINQRGVVRADSASVDAAGRIVFRASDTAILDAGSATSASGVRGGEIQVLGDKVGLVGNARIDASGEVGGGTVLVGGDFQGRNPEVPNAFRTYFGPEATITADAIASGDGGKVIVWSDDATRAYGTINARGGAQGGNGGFVEVSGKSWLEFQGKVDTSAPMGASGTLLLDPSDVDIVSGSDTLAGGAGFDGGNPNNIFTGGSGASSIGWGTIKTHLTTTNGGTNVVITTSPNFSGQCSIVGACGDIDVINDSPDLASSNTLSLLAHRNINVTGGGITNSGGGTLELWAGWNGASATTPALGNAGNITITKPINLSGAVAGEVLLHANNNITDSAAAGGVITANKLLASTNSGSVPGSVLLDSNSHMVDIIAGNSSDQFLFKNGKSLEIGTVAGINGINVTALSSFSDSAINIQLTSGSLLVTQPIASNASDPLGAASIALTADTGAIGVTNSSISAQAITGLSTGAGGSATVVLQSGPGTSVNLDGGTVSATGGDGVGGSDGGGAASVTLTGPGQINVANSSAISATGGSGGPTGGAATVSLSSTSGGIGVNGSSVSSVGGAANNTFGTGGSARVGLEAGTSIVLGDLAVPVAISATAGTSIGSTISFPPPTTYWPAIVAVVANSGNIESNADITANGTVGTALIGTTTYTGSVVLDAPNGHIHALTAGSGLLTVQNGGILGAVRLNAKNGIGQVGAPIRIADDFATIIATNTTANDVVLNLLTGSWFLDGSFMSVSNTASAPGGLIDLTAQAGDIYLSTAYTLSSPNGSISLTAAGATAGNGLIEVPSGTSVSAPNGSITLTADNQTIDGTVSAPAGTAALRPYDLGRQINVESSPSASVLSLTLAEIQNVTATTLEIGRSDGTGTGAMVVSAFPTSANLNAGTLKLFAQDISLATPIGGTGSEFAHHLEMRASNNLSIGDSTILLADGSNLALVADSDGSGAGNLAVSNSLGLGNDRTILAGTSSANAATMLLQGHNISVTDTAGSTMTVILQGSGAQTVTATGTLSIEGGSIQADGTQTVSANSIQVLGGSTFGQLWGGTQNVTAGAGGIVVQAGTGTGNNASIEHTSSSGTQTIVVSGGGTVVVTGGSSGSGNFAQILSRGDQSITGAAAISLSGGASGGGFNTGNFAKIGSAGSQVIAVGSGGLSLSAGGGEDNAAILTQDGTTGKNQTITVNAGGSITVQGGSSAATGVGSGHGSRAQILSSGDSQTIAFTSGGAIDLTGGSVGSRNYALILTENAQTISGSPDITLTGGPSGGIAGESNFARISSNAGPQEITASAITLQGGTAGIENLAQIGQFGISSTQTITVSGTVSLTGGGGTSNLARIRNLGTAQTISAAGISLTGGASGGGSDTGNYSQIYSDGDQDITVGSLGLSITGGGGALTDNFASVFQAGLAGTSQTVTVNGGGSITLQGGSSSQQDVQPSAPPPHHGSFAALRGDGDSQLISFTSGGSISLTGGTAGSNNYAIIRAPSGTQTISGEPDITVTGGASGGVDGEGNFAMIQANLGAQDIAANNLTLAAGAAGINNFAVIQAPTQGISVLGNLVITGGGSAASADGTTGGGARIGGLGGTGATATDLVLSVDGNVTLTGGSVSGAAVGSNIQGGQTTDVVMSVGGNVTLDPGTGVNGGSRIGSPIAGVAGGDITLLAGGNIAMNSAGPGLGSSVRTLGNVTLDANAITQGADSALEAGGFAALSTVAGTTLAGTSNIGTLLLASGNLTLSGTLTTSALLIPDGIKLNGTGTVIGDVSNSGTIAPGTSTGLLTVSGNYTQSSTGALTVEIGGTTVGTEYDRLAVSGTASLDGTLNVSEGAVAPVAGTTYAVITCGSCTGTFAALNSPTVNVTPTYGATSFTLPFTSFLNSWNSGGTGAWETASNWSRGVVPGASDDVTIDDPSSVATVTISGGTQAARSIVSNENLTLSGGSLNLAASSTVNGDLTLSGGTLNLGGGTLTVGGTLNLSGLSTVIDGAGNLVANGALNWSGDADMRGAGTLTTNGITTGNDPMYVGRNWLNNGTINVASGRLEIAATLTNASGGIVNIQTTGAGNVVDDWGGALVNQGQFNYSAAGTATVAVPFSNEGTLTIADGTLNWIGGVTNSGTVNLAGAGSIRLPSGGPAFSNAAGGTLNIDSTAGWSFVSNPTTQDGAVDNAGTINVNTGTAWEVAFTQAGTGSLNIAAGKFLSLQNGQSIAGTVNVGTGSTLWVSERHGVNASFSGTTIGGSGTVQVVAGAGPVADFTNVSAPSAKLLVGSGGTANVLAGTTTFAALEITGGTLDGDGTLNVTASLNQSGGSQSGGGTTVLASGATGTLGAVSVGRNLTNIGTLDLSGTSISGLFTNAGVVNVTGVVSASGGMMQNAGLTTVPAGQTLGVGGSGLVLAGGTLVGNGTIDGNVFNTAGIVAPGASPGILTINGDYTQGANGALTVDVGGTIAGSEYDQLVVNGDVFLDGNLNTLLFGSYTPLPGDSYTIISATGTITGSFANVFQPAGLLPPTAAGPAATSPSQLTVSAISASLPPAIEPTYNYTVVATEISSEPVENILVPVLGGEGTTTSGDTTLEKKPPACS
ncbi:MAG: filamentous hemagglutinin N-terminal domain-containing protein [Betaproteobacteria bacterium]|nr:MAG: filamentous hemagglutinin N-terminal domain-containing protein [Betaproteobacteria bacterium]